MEWNYTTLRVLMNQEEIIEFNDKKFPLNCVILNDLGPTKERFDILFGRMRITLEKLIRYWNLLLSKLLK